MASCSSLNVPWKCKWKWKQEQHRAHPHIFCAYRPLHAKPKFIRVRRPEDIRKSTTQEQANPFSDSNLLSLFATCAPGLEFVVAAELQSTAIGAVNVKEGTRGVYFQGTWRTAFLANLWLRCGVRVLQLISSGNLTSSPDCVYDFVQSATNWKQLLVSKDGNENFLTFSVQSRVWDCEEISSSLQASTRAKDAICDALRRDCGGQRPQAPEDPHSADMPLFLSLYRDKAMLYRDMSGKSLHRRGYRTRMHKASLNEAVAAGILSISGWNNLIPTFNKSSAYSKNLLDPMCGSGTFLIEAALMALNIAPGLMRDDWPFMSWHDFDERAWEECEREASQARLEEPANDIQLLGNDIHEGAIMLCEQDAEKAGVKNLLKLSCKDIRRYAPSCRASLVTVNPPWGARLEEEHRLIATYMGLGKFLKKHCNEADVYLLSGNSSLSRQMQMKADRKWPLTVGGLDCRLLHYYVLPPKVVDYTKQLQTVS